IGGYQPASLNLTIQRAIKVRGTAIGNGPRWLISFVFADVDDLEVDRLAALEATSIEIGELARCIVGRIRKHPGGRDQPDFQRFKAPPMPQALFPRRLGVMTRAFARTSLEELEKRRQQHGGGPWCWILGV